MSEALSLSDFAAQLSAADADAGQATEAPASEAQESEQIEDDTTEGQAAAEQSTEGEGQEETDSEDGQAKSAPDEEMVIKWTTASGETRTRSQILGNRPRRSKPLHPTNPPTHPNHRQTTIRSKP